MYSFKNTVFCEKLQLIYFGLRESDPGLEQSTTG